MILLFVLLEQQVIMASTTVNPYEQYLERYLEAAAEGDMKTLQVILKGKKGKLKNRFICMIEYHLLQAVKTAFQKGYWPFVSLTYFQPMVKRVKTNLC